MNTRLRTLLLITLTFALAIAPMRGALAITALAATDTESGCAEMMHTKPSSDSTPRQHHHETQASETDNCCQDCDGTCGDSNCTHCVHSSTAILSSISFLMDAHGAALTVPVAVSFPPGNFTPPFRPPVSL